MGSGQIYIVQISQVITSLTSLNLVNAIRLWLQNLYFK